jgi:predicted transcriptional regulator of viral defense system
MIEVQETADSEQLGNVYFIQAGDVSGLIKIGFTYNVSERLKKLRSGSPIPLTLLAVIKGAQRNEHEFHVKFAEAREHGEWFRPEAIILDEIKQINELVKAVDSSPVSASRISKLEVESNNADMEPYNLQPRQIISKNEAKVVAELETSQKHTITLFQIAKIIEAPQGGQQARSLAANMCRHGWLSPLSLRGAFAFHPAVSGHFPSGASWLELRVALERNPQAKAHIGLGSAAWLQHFADRRPLPDTVVWCSNAVVPEGLAANYRVVRCAPDRYFGAEKNGVMVSIPERIALEVALWPKYAGDLRSSEHWLASVFEKVDVDVLAAGAEQLGPAVTGRLGYLAQQFNAERVYRELVDLPMASPVWLGDRAAEAKKYDDQWGCTTLLGWGWTCDYAL